MCDKYILENVKTFKSVPNWYKNQKLCNQAVDSYAHALKFILECYKSHKKCDNAANRFIFIFDSVPNCYKKCVNSPIDIKAKEWIMKLLIIACQHENSFLIGFPPVNMVEKFHDALNANNGTLFLWRFQ